MGERMKRLRSLATAVLIALVFTVPLAAEPFDKKAKADPDGLGAQFWQLAMSLPPAVNPFLDETQCGRGQHGDTWFLYSTAVPTETPEDPIDVACTVPVRKRIFLALITAFCTPEVGDTIPSLREECGQGLDVPGFLRLEIDGVDRSRLIDRRASKFTLPIPPDNIFAPDLPAGIYTAVHDGYYALLPPLEAGEHTIVVQSQIVLDDGQMIAFSTRHVVTIAKPDSILPLPTEP